MGGLRFRRWRCARRGAPDARLRALWSAALPAVRAPLSTLSFLVCDAEMSSLDPERGELLSLGWVRIEGTEIQVASARHCLLRNRRSVGQSATVHGLRDCELERGASAEQALGALLRAARGGVLVFHHAALDLAFLNRACARAFGAPLLMPVVDTLVLEQRLMQRRDRSIAPGALRLSACRARYCLPVHRAHNALADALATAELFLAHCAARGGRLRLRDLL